MLETVNIPAIQDQKIAEGDFTLSPLSYLVAQILLFIRNATLDNRSNKVHFLKNDEFLPSLMTFLCQENMHPKIKAYTAAVLWSLVHNHQGIKAALNKSAVISELQMMKAEYQSQVDQAKYSGSYGRGPGATTSDGRTMSGNVVKDPVNLEYHANYQVADRAHQEETNKLMAQDMNAFILKAV